MLFPTKSQEAKKIEKHIIIVTVKSSKGKQVTIVGVEQ